MAQIDFITALARLLRDGALRDVYRSDPLTALESLDVIENERAPLLNLDATDLECQAQVLLRKRFETVSHLLPHTVSNLSEQAWPVFSVYARTCWPSGQPAESLDAQNFLNHLLINSREAICIAESNRVRFALGNKRLAMHAAILTVRQRKRKCLQVFLRRKPSWSEYVLYFG